MDGQSDSLRGRLTCHCLLVETNDGLVLVDSGFGTRDVADPASRLAKLFLVLLEPDLREELTAIRQIERLGFDARDVRHIVLTHLDFDHAGGLDDFPDASVHMLALERDYAALQKTWLDQMRFRPQQWSTSGNWKVYRSGEGEPWFGFDAVRELDGVSPDILLVPLLGHTYGHAGVAVRRDTDWLFLTGDAYFYHREMDPKRPYCTPGLRFYQRMMEKDRHARLWNQGRLRELARTHRGEVEVICSHDLKEFERCAGRPYDAPATIGPGRMGVAPVTSPPGEEEHHP